MSPVTRDDTLEPLSAHRLFKTQDIDEAREIVAAHFCPHELTPGASHGSFESCHNRAAGKSVSLNYLRYTSDVTIEPGELDRFYLVQVPLRGAASVRNGKRHVLANSRRASVLNPTRATRMTWHSGCEKILLQIDRSVLHRIAEEWLGQELNDAIVFDPDMPLTTEAIRHWCLQLSDSVQSAQLGIAFQGDAYRSQSLIEENLILGILLGQPSTISHMMTERCRAPASSELRRALAFMHASLIEPITLNQIAAEAGCSIRSLQVGFKASFGHGPMQYLNKRRLQMAHYRLQSLSADTTVSAIAYDCGFSHLGRFSTAYKQAYGCSPRKTLLLESFSTRC